MALLAMGYTGRPTRGWGGDLPLTGTEPFRSYSFVVVVACGKAKHTDPLTDVQRISLYKATFLNPAL